jgi:hypothetical protein
VNGEVMIRDINEDKELRALMNTIVSRYNSDSSEQFENKASDEEYSNVENDIRTVWATYFSSGNLYDSDRDVLRVLKSIPYTFWPKDIYLEAAAVISRMTQSPVVRQVAPERLNKDSRFLLEYLDDKTSQSGEDGIIWQIFDVMGVKNSWCVEFGAWDGKMHSNTYNLMVEKHWNGVLIEGDEARFRDLELTYEGNTRAHLFNQMVGFDPKSDSIDFILGKVDVPNDLDLMIVDIDGNDWHVWDSMQTYRPRLVAVEFNPTIPNDIVFIQERTPERQQGCSLRALIELGKTKGYELVCATRLNGLFVVSEEFSKFGIADNTIDAMHAPEMDGRIFQGYDSTIHVIGMPKRMWNWHGFGSDWANGLPDYIKVY